MKHRITLHATITWDDTQHPNELKRLIKANGTIDESEVLWDLHGGNFPPGVVETFSCEHETL